MRLTGTRVGLGFGLGVELVAVLGVLFGGILGMELVIPVHSGDLVVSILEDLVFGPMTLALLADADLVDTLFDSEIFAILLWLYLGRAKLLIFWISML